MKPTSKAAIGLNRRNSLTASEAAQSKAAPSPFTHAANTFGEARALCRRISDLAERLVSHYPPPSGETADAAAGNVFASLDTDAYDTDAALSRAADALNAIESALP